MEDTQTQDSEKGESQDGRRNLGDIPLSVGAAVVIMALNYGGIGDHGYMGVERLHSEEDIGVVIDHREDHNIFESLVFGFGEWDYMHRSGMRGLIDNSPSYTCEFRSTEDCVATLKLYRREVPDWVRNRVR